MTKWLRSHTHTCTFDQNNASAAPSANGTPWESCDRMGGQGFKFLRGVLIQCPLRAEHVLLLVHEAVPVQVHVLEREYGLCPAHQQQSADDRSDRLEPVRAMMAEPPAGERDAAAQAMACALAPLGESRAGEAAAQRNGDTGHEQRRAQRAAPCADPGPRTSRRHPTCEGRGGSRASGPRATCRGSCAETTPGSRHCPAPRRPAPAWLVPSTPRWVQRPARERLCMAHQGVERRRAGNGARPAEPWGAMPRGRGAAHVLF